MGTVRKTGSKNQFQNPQRHTIPTCLSTLLFGLCLSVQNLQFRMPDFRYGCISLLMKRSKLVQSVSQRTQADRTGNRILIHPQLCGPDNQLQGFRVQQIRIGHTGLFPAADFHTQSFALAESDEL